MDRGADICSRTFEFAVRVVALCRHLDGTPGVERVLGKQLLRAGTSIGANIEEAQQVKVEQTLLAKLPSRSKKHAKQPTGYACLLRRKLCLKNVSSLCAQKLKR